ncbi:hypothetical protein CSC42_0005 [Pseudomonas aeruginosa]|nr:hypothetical protein CSC42_0005 [Pseudomonas aeruginosa]
MKRGNALLHDYLYKRLPELVDHPDGQHEAIAAPRGNAKSTLVSQIFVIWCVLTAASITPYHHGCLRTGATMLEAIKAELEFNPRLAMDFPQGRQGRVWQVAPSLRRTMPRSRSSAPASGCAVFDTARIS